MVNVIMFAILGVLVVGAVITKFQNNAIDARLRKNNGRLSHQRAELGRLLRQVW